MFKIKTPHHRPLWHLLNMIGLFVFGAAVTTGFHLGAFAPGGMFTLPLLASVLTAGVIALGLGVLVTAVTRRALNLVQTGRVIQYCGFTFSSYVGLKAAVYFFASIALTAPILAAVTTFAVAFGIATATGEVPTRGRKWLPVRSKKGAPKA